MKRFVFSLPILALWLFYSIPLYCQNYLNIRYLDGSDRNVPLGSLQKITFDESAGNLNIRLTDATTQAVAFNTLQKITSGDAGAGDLLPVELATFIATANHNTVALSWRTATEVNNYGFDIERRIIGKTDWPKIAFIEGNGTSNIEHVYSYSDNNLAEGRYAYRLKQIDMNGSFRYSQSVEVEINIVPIAFALSQNYPNPFNPATNISFSLPTKSFLTLKVYDLIGREVATIISEELQAGTYTRQWNAANFSSGVYFCKMSSVAQSSITKMIIMK